ncbi:MAG: iron ABC transporter permease [Thermosphaera sp.]
MHQKILFVTALVLAILPLGLTLLWDLERSDYSTLINTYRIFRVLYVTLSGLIIGGSGAVLQSSLRNPLLDHHILGIGGGALFAVYVASLLGRPSYYLLMLSGVLGGLAALAMTVTIAEKFGGTVTAYILSGIGVSSLFSGSAMLLSYFLVSKNPYSVLLLTGSFVIATPEKIYAMLPAAIISSTVFIALSKPLNTILISDEYSKQLGYNPRKIRLFLILVAGISTSIVVSNFGIIGFVGLASPHLARMILRTSDNRLVVPLSMSSSVLILYATDFLSRKVLVAPIGEVPSGAIASLIGAPFFLIVMIKNIKRFSM